MKLQIKAISLFLLLTISTINLKSYFTYDNTVVKPLLTCFLVPGSIMATGTAVMFYKLNKSGRLEKVKTRARFVLKNIKSEVKSNAKKACFVVRGSTLLETVQVLRLTLNKIRK